MTTREGWAGPEGPGRGDSGWGAGGRRGGTPGAAAEGRRGGWWAWRGPGGSPLLERGWCSLVISSQIHSPTRARTTDTRNEVQYRLNLRSSDGNTLLGPHRRRGTRRQGRAGAPVCAGAPACAGAAGGIVQRAWEGRARGLSCFTLGPFWLPPSCVLSVVVGREGDGFALAGVTHSIWAPGLL